MTAPHTEPRAARGNDVAPGRGDVAEAVVDSLNHDGGGVARVRGKVVFIDGALPGERVRFRYHNKRKSHDTGRVLKVLERSAHRTTPACPYFGVCGGCGLQHLEVGAQARGKQQVVAQTLRHIGSLQPRRWFEPITGPLWHYRRRARLGARLVPKKGGVLVGFREKRHSFITDLDACLTLAEPVARMLPALRDLIGGLSRPDRVPQIEVVIGENATALVLRHLEPLNDADRTRLRAFGAAQGVQIHGQPGGVESVTPLYPEAPAALRYGLPEFEVTLEFRATDFIQIDGVVNRRMVQQALALLAVQPQDRILELFCGLGNFTLPMARQGVPVLGIDGDAGLIARARRNAAINRLGARVGFRHADLYAPGGITSAWADCQFNKLLLDPPRAGAIDVLKQLPQDGPRRIVYVSCNPETLARDGEYLAHARGYHLAAAGILDMFPHTSHVETMALFVQP